MATPRQGSTILPIGSYSTDLAQVVRGLNQVVAASQGVFSALRAGLEAVKSQVVSFVEKANPAAVQKFTFAVDDLTGVIGRSLLPVLVNSTAIIQKLADYFHDLSPAAHALVAGLVAAAVGFTVVAVAVWGLNAAFSTLTGGLSTILGALGALVAGMLVAASGTDELKDAMDLLLAPMSDIIDQVAEIATSLVSALAPLIELGLKTFAAVLAGIAAEIEMIMPALLKFIAWIKAIGEFVLDVLNVQFPNQPGNAPKAPSAVRPAQIGGLNDFINRQMVSALQTPATQRDPIKIGLKIAEDVAMIRQKIEAFLGKAQELRPIGEGVKLAGGGALQNPAGAVAWIAQRLVFNGIIGKP